MLYYFQALKPTLIILEIKNNDSMAQYQNVPVTPSSTLIKDSSDSNVMLPTANAVEPNSSISSQNVWTT